MLGLEKRLLEEEKSAFFMWDDVGKGFAILLVNTVLSGDNALMIAMVTAKLPPAQRWRGMVFGLSLTIVLRVALTIIAGKLFILPYLEAIGGLLLVYFAFSLTVGAKGRDVESGQNPEPATERLVKAVISIIIADLSMSLDNVIALAGIANGNWSLLLVGTALSLLIILLASQFISRLLVRYSWLMYVGSGILAWTGGGMIGRDPALSQKLSAVPFLPVWITLFVLFFAYIVDRIRTSKG